MTNESIKVGQRVEAGKGEDHDEGRVLEINGDEAWIGWDSGVCTWIAISELTEL